MMSFLYHPQDTRHFLNLATRFPLVSMKYYGGLLRDPSAPDNLIISRKGMADRIASETPHEPKEMAHMVLCLKIYRKIVLHHAHPSRLGKLQQSLLQYRARLVKISVTYRYDCIRESTPRS